MKTLADLAIGVPAVGTISVPRDRQPCQKWNQTGDSALATTLRDLQVCHR